MSTITAVILLFIFLCIAFPRLVKHRPQLFVAVGCVVAIILLDAVGQMVHSDGFARVLYVFNAMLQIVAIGMLILGMGGMAREDLTDEMRRAFEVILPGRDTLAGSQPARPSKGVARKPQDQSGIPME